MHRVVWGLVLILLVLHQDIWFWNNETLIFGFMPIGLFFHACISVGAALTWWLATQYCWPGDLEYQEANAQPEGEAT